MYNSVFDACVPLNTHSSLAGTIAIPAADTILFMLMLVGLLRRTHGNKVGIWRVLYNQVTSNFFRYPSHQVLKIPTVHRLDDRGRLRGDTTDGQWSFSTLLISLVFTPVFLGFPHPRFKSCVFSK